jgi:hypothetical protein
MIQKEAFYTVGFALGMEVRRAETLGSVHDSPINAQDFGS